MSQPTPPLHLSARLYQSACGLALAAIFLLQLQQSAQFGPSRAIFNLLMLFIGFVFILVRVRFSPMIVLLAIAVPLVIDGYNANRRADFDFGDLRVFQLDEILMCMAVLTYLIALYRLQGLWFGVLPPDKRLIRAETQKPGPPNIRSEESLSTVELVALIFTIPVFVLVAEVACIVLKQDWGLLDLAPRWNQFLIVVWILLVGMFLAGHAFRHWRRLQMDRVSALIMLQDILWNETRGEQRRINRWMAWKKLREMRKKP